MGVEEVWTNRNLNAADPDFTYSPLIRLNGTMYDKLIADPYFGFAPLGKMLPEGFVDMSFVLALVKEPESYDAPLEEHFMDTMLLKNLHALAWHY